MALNRPRGPQRRSLMSYSTAGHPNVSTRLGEHRQRDGEQSQELEEAGFPRQVPVVCRQAAGWVHAGRCSRQYHRPGWLRVVPKP
jgi:hypothetical protein